MWLGRLPVGRDPESRKPEVVWRGGGENDEAGRTRLEHRLSRPRESCVHLLGDLFR